MLSLSEVFKAQSKYGVSSVVSNNESVTYEVYLSSCRSVLYDRTPIDFYDWDRARRNDYTDNLIVNFVRNNVKDVEGFVDANGDIMQDALIDRLRIDIVDFGILKQALEDDSIQEIQINDYKTIWVVRGGKSSLYTDQNGKPYQFVSDIELRSTLDRLIYNPNSATSHLTVTNPLLNARTADKGYRVSAVNNSATTPDMTAGFDFPVTTVTIRKYAPSMLKFDDFERSDTLTREMSTFLRLCGKADIVLICCGPTSSGKTTLLNSIVWEIPRDQRLILIQNPTEIMVYERSEETGANLRNVVHWEAADVDIKLKSDPTTQTMSNEIAHTLRNTPDVIIPGEVRTAQEMEQMNRAISTGHRLLSTLHAYDGKDAIKRIATELSTIGGNMRDYVISLSSSIGIIVSQRKFPDGKRHVMTIEEPTGRVDEHGLAVTSVIFRYVLTGEVDYKPNGDIEKIHGYFQIENAISDELVQKFYSAGVSKKQLEFFTNPPSIIEGRSNLGSNTEIVDSIVSSTVESTSSEELDLFSI